MSMQLDIISPDKCLYTGEVALIQLPGLMGSFEILNLHAPLIALLVKGRVKIIDQARNKLFIDINGGVVEVFNDKIKVLTE